VLEAINGDTVIYLTPEYVILKKYYEEAVRLVCHYIRGHGRIELGDFRDMIQSGRKASLMLLEYLDKQRITRRMETYRVLGDKAEAEG
jgi:selenocysteine-specific elongation factor